MSRLNGRGMCVKGNLIEFVLKRVPEPRARERECSKLRGLPLQLSVCGKFLVQNCSRAQAHEFVL